MRWIPAILSLPLLASALAAEPAAAPPAVAPGSVELGGRFAPTMRTTVKWQTRTELTAGKYTGIRGIIPMEGKLDKTDEREILTTYLPGGPEEKREVTVVKGRVTQSETFEGKTETSERTHALEGVPVHGLRTDGTWVFAPATGEATDAQKPELDRLGRRANQEVDLFEGVTAKPGDSWDLDPVKFLKAAGFDDFPSAKGAAKASLKEVVETPEGPEAVISLQIDLRAQQESTPAGSRVRLHIQYTGVLRRQVRHRLDRLVELDGRMTLSGENVTPDGLRAPFTLATPVKFRSERSIVPGG